MKNKQSYIIAGMTILIVVLCFFLYNSGTNAKIYEEKIQLKELINQKKSIEKQTDSVSINLLKNSEKSVIQSKLIINKIKHETPKVKDTTDIYMYQYIINYRPKR